MMALTNSHKSFAGVFKLDALGFLGFDSSSGSVSLGGTSAGGPASASEGGWAGGTPTALEGVSAGGASTGLEQQEQQ